MGWWNAGEAGESLQIEETGMMWGDSPADIMDQCIDEIVGDFRSEWNRKPTKSELRSGLEFALNGYEEEEP